MARRNVRRAQEDYFNSSADGATAVVRLEFELTSIDLTYEDGTWYCDVEAEDWDRGELRVSGSASDNELEGAIDYAINECLGDLGEWDYSNRTPIEELISEAESWYDENEEYLESLEASRHARRRFSARLNNRRRRARR